MTTAAAFNGGRSQVNFNDINFGCEYPFLNCVKTGAAWKFLDNTHLPITPDMLDSNGYPLSIVHGGVYTVFGVPAQANRSGNYVITWTGNGTVVCNMNNTLVSGSKTGSGGSGRYVFSTTDATFVVGISATPVTNLQVFHVDDETAINAGQVFGVKFKQRLIEANFGVLRFLNYSYDNTSNITTWATRKPVSYVYYAGDDRRASIYAGVTTNSGNAYSVSAPSTWPGLVDKATVSIVFNASATQSGTCSLNVAGTGAINILNTYGEALSSNGGFSYPIGGNDNSLATLTYDATLNAWIKHGGDLSGSIGLNSGLPYELAVQICAEVGAHPFFAANYLSVDPATDFIPSLAAYCRDNGPSWMIPRFEGPNECWNFQGGFYATHYGNAKGTAYGWGSTGAEYHDWYGKVMSVMGQAVSIAYSGDRSRYQVICGVQTTFGNTDFNVTTHDERLASTKYLAQTPQSGYTASAAKNWVTHICCNQYIHPTAEDDGSGRAATLAAAYAGGDQTAPTTYINTLFENTVAPTLVNLASIATFYARWKTWAKGFGVNKMCGYEGGYSPDYTGDTQLDALRAAGKLVPALSDATLQNYNSFVGLTDGTFTAEFPSCFQLGGKTPSATVWSVLEDIYQTPNPPQWTAIMAFNQTLNQPRLAINLRLRIHG